jgi:hypothetical protein
MTLFTLGEPELDRGLDGQAARLVRAFAFGSHPLPLVAIHAGMDPGGEWAWIVAALKGRSVKSENVSQPRRLAIEATIRLRPLTKGRAVPATQDGERQSPNHQWAAFALRAPSDARSADLAIPLPESGSCLLTIEATTQIQREPDQAMWYYLALEPHSMPL